MAKLTGAQLFAVLNIVYVIVSLGTFATTNADKVDQGHRDSHHEKDYLHQIVKRYAVGLSYLHPRLGVELDNNVAGSDDVGYYPVEKRYRSNSMHTNPAASHFRELQDRQIRRPSGDESPAELLQSYRNFLEYNGGLLNDNEGGIMEQPFGRNVDDGAVAPLSDEEIQALLLLLENYKLQSNSQQASGHLYSPSAQYIPGEDGPLLGKRETGKRSLVTHRSKAQLEQPMSFENSANDGGVIYLGQKRSKRIGSPPAKQSSSIRIKKETDPAVEAGLDKIFAGVVPEKPNSSHQLIPTTAISSNHQIPPPSSISTPMKKAIDWSDYFGIDKRNENKHSSELSTDDSSKQASSSASSTSSPGGVSATINHHNNGEELKKVSNDKSAAKVSTSPSLEGSHGQSSTSQKTGKLKDKKDKSRLENDTEQKADRKWILKEFYKNLAMSTNVRKRKRESPNGEIEEESDKLQNIERKMEEAGDQIIWDALKYTGAHKDAKLSSDELARVKNEIIHKLATAYSLEKIREAIEDFRQQLAQLKDKQQYY